MRWNPVPAKDGIGAFAGLEEDRGGVHPVKHIYVQGDDYRFDMHTVDRDSSGGSDRQRSEAKDMGDLKILQDQTWRIAWSYFIPETLNATERFTHIFQYKVKDIGAPLVTFSLRRKGGGGQVEMNGDGLSGEGATDFAQFRGKWMHTQIEAKASTSGYVRWWLWNEAGENVLDFRKDGVSLWRGTNWLRPKWGIYRSLQSSGLQDTYLLIRDFVAFQLV